MKNIIISMVAKISKMDAEAKLLTAQVEAQSLMLSALLLTVGKNGGVEKMVESVNKAINSAMELSDDLLRSDAQMLLTQFNELLAIARLIENADAEVDLDSLTTPPL
ncbi:anti-adapter protein IraP [Enterobacteriaceae bacterium 155047]|uniref:anti-adapter protein IraP n=1 Tax=Huaxiibacter chinensis TaxID=2899785 RepID=UPI0007DA93E5|nr:anti-adapter protein IraP [Huaxiibacter chinensis]ANG92682.1 anti-RssB factor [Lelliottia amnigena]MCG5042477.1 anti-adapter protein IraP [Huaxiibacter chinensis]